MDEISTFSHQTLLALEYMHKEEVIHRDLKPHNILVEHRDPLHIRLADFGISKEGTSFRTIDAGTGVYMAPEPRGCYGWKRPSDRRAAQCLELGWELGLFDSQGSERISVPRVEEPEFFSTQSSGVSECYNSKYHTCSTSYAHIGDPALGYNNDGEEGPKTIIPTTEDSDVTMKTAPPYRPSSYQDSDITMRTAPTYYPWDYSDYIGPQPRPSNYTSFVAASSIAGEQQNSTGTGPAHRRSTTPQRSTNRIDILEPVKEATPEAMDRVLSNDAAQYFQLQFRNGKFKIRKEDRRVDMCQALALAGLGPSSTTSSQGPRSLDKVAKPRRRERKFITLTKAIAIAQQKKIPDLVAVLQTFSSLYEFMALDRSPKTELLTVDEGGNDVTDASEEVLDTQRLNVESYIDSRSSSATPGLANSPRAVTPSDYGVDAAPNPEVVINSTPAEEGPEFTLPEEQYEDEAFTTMVKTTANLERNLTDPSYMTNM